MNAHAFLPPSGASAWKRCALWPTMNARYPQDDTPASIEGTAAHWVATEMHAGRAPAEGTAAPNAVIVTGEMLEGAELVCEAVEQRMRNLIVHVEEQVSIPIIPDAEPTFGTPDYWAFCRVRRHLEIVDYKFGHGYVNEHFNEQGLLYALGILALHKNLMPPGADVGDWSVAFTIVQPRCYHRGEPVRTHAYSLRAMYRHLEELRAAANAAMVEKPTATTNEECRHCPGRHACSALQMAAYSDAEFSSRSAPHDLTPAAASLELRMLERAYERLGARVDGLQELVLANIKAGKRVPHHRVEAGRGREQWNVEPEKLIGIGQLFGKSLAKPGVITPAQARKKGIDASVISAYSSIIPGAQKLVAENNSEAAKVFGK